MSQEQASCECCLAVLAPKTEDRPARANRVVVDPRNLAFLPIVELKLLAYVRAFRDKADALDEGGYIGGADASFLRCIIFAFSHGP